MTYGITELVVGALATWQIVEVWRHSALLAGWRARVELLEGRVGEMLRCPFCLSVWVGFVVALVVVPEVHGFPMTPEELGRSLFSLVMLVLAAGISVPAAVLLIRLVTTAPGAFRASGVTWPYAAAFLVVGFFGSVWVFGAYSAWDIALRHGSVFGAADLLTHGLKTAVLGFAVARLANVGNDLTHAWSRTPRADLLDAALKSAFGNEGTSDPGPSNPADGAADLRPGGV